MNKYIKIGISLFLTILALFLGIVIISYFILKSKIPEYEGKISVKGISNEVKIYRDEHAIPFIITKSEFDAVFALGFVHAQERLFQMDVSRRAGQGKLSEIFGSSTIPFDKMFRTVGINKLVKESLPKLNPLSIKYLEAYSAGVNAYIKQADGNYTFEFDVLGYEPELWKPEHSLIIAKLMAWELNISWWTDFAFSNLVQKLGEEKVKEILPDFEENAPTIIPNYLKLAASIETDFYKVDKDFRKFTGFVGTHIGSNNWVVNSNKSESGKVIIANDPHLAFQAPGKFMFSVIRSDVWNGEGFSIPGLPAFIIGKNQNIAWVLTNVMADDADFYIEKFDSSGTKYFIDDKWLNLSIVDDTIYVKSENPIIYKIKKNHRGPIISDIHPFGEKGNKNNAKISMRWTALNKTDEIFAMISINQSKNWKDFERGVEHFTAPGQNFVYGDKNGNIGYICGAKLPIRSSNSPTLIFDGTTTANDWQGFVPYSQMPKLFNPSDNFIASANNKTIKNFSYHISNLWEPESRIERITELLTQKQKHSANDFKKYQNDFYSHYAKKIVPFVLEAFKDVKIKDENLKTALSLLKNWDFYMNKDNQTPTIFNEFFQKLTKNIFYDEMGEELFKEYVFVANVPYRKVNELLNDISSDWWNNVKTENYETRDDIIRKSLVDALISLETKLGKDITLWQWKELHKVTFKHLFTKNAPMLEGILNIGPFPIGGDGTTIFNTEYSFANSDSYKNKLGPALRFIYDFAKPDEVNIILPTGESGYFMSKHYNDMTQHWLNGRYLKININTSDIENRNYNLLKLTTE
jgi:penicillin amidase